MITDEQAYVHSRMNWFDKLCRWSYVLPITTFLILMGYLIHRSLVVPEDAPWFWNTEIYGLLGGFVATFGLFILSKMILGHRIRSYEMEYYIKNRRE